MGKVRDQRKEHYWRRLLRERRVGGKSVAEFCGERGVSVPQFYWWQRELRSREVGAATRVSKEDQGFVPVRLPLISSAIEIVHPGGCVIRVASGVDAQSLRCVLDSLNPAEA